MASWFTKKIIQCKHTPIVCTPHRCHHHFTTFSLNSTTYKHTTLLIACGKVSLYVLIIALLVQAVLWFLFANIPDNHQHLFFIFHQQLYRMLWIEKTNLSSCSQFFLNVYFNSWPLLCQPTSNAVFSVGLVFFQLFPCSSIHSKVFPVVVKVN